MKSFFSPVFFNFSLPFLRLSIQIELERFFLLQNNNRTERMGCSLGSEAMVFPISSLKSIKSISNIRTSNFLRSHNRLLDIISEAVNLKSDSPTEHQLAFAAETLSKHQLFASLTPEQIKAVTTQMVLATSHKGTTIFSQGDECSCFFIILSGTVEVHVDHGLVRALSTGETFGELALLFHCPRTASIVCRSKECLFLLMKPGLYRGTLQKMKLEEQERCLASIGKVPLFGCLTNKQKFAISNALKMAVFQPGQVIFQKGDDVQMVYILSEGLVKISIPDKGDIFLREGEIFGEASLGDHQKHHRRKGTAVAVQRSVCSMISRKDIEIALGSSISNLIYYNIKRWALMRSSIFKNLSISQIHQTIIEFKPLYMKNGATLDQHLYKGFVICLEGKINNQQNGVIFNENHWKKQTYDCDSLVKNGDGYCSFLSFSRAKQLFQEFESQTNMLIIRDNLQQKLSLNNHQLNLNDFTFIKKIGQGQFGRVLLVKNNRYGNHLYALKCMSKKEIKKESLEAAVINERKILEKTIFPYIVGFVKAFQDEINLYLLMEYIHGKDLFDVIREAKKVTVDMGRYYIGCLILSIEYLHMHSIVYRDLKPENAVVDWKGKLLLVDLGTAVLLKPEKFYKTFTIIGTPHYMAPEMFEGNGYSFQVDLWSLGCLLFELLCYSLPFGEKTDDPYLIYSDIKQNTPRFPNFLKDQSAKELITHLLTKDPRERGLFTFEKVKRSAYFRDFDWKKLLKEQMAPPYVPPCFQNWKIDEILKIEGKKLFKYLYSREGQANLQEWNENIQ